MTRVLSYRPIVILASLVLTLVCVQQTVTIPSTPLATIHMA